MSASLTVTDRQEVKGTLETAPHSGQGEVTVRLASGGRVRVPVRLLRREGDEQYHFEDSFERFAAERREAASVVEEEALPLVEEEVRVRKEKRETGRVHIRKRVREHTETIDEPLLRETVDVERVPIGTVITAPAQTRRDGDTTIIPIMEERLVVVKELVLKEEVHVTRHQTTHHEPQDVTLRREEAEVERSNSKSAPGTVRSGERSS